MCMTAFLSTADAASLKHSMTARQNLIGGMAEGHSRAGNGMGWDERGGEKVRVAKSHWKPSEALLEKETIGYRGTN